MKPMMPMKGPGAVKKPAPGKKPYGPGFGLKPKLKK